MSATITKPQHHTTIRSFPVVDIRPNPFRNIKQYPLQPEKIKALRESFRATDFWDCLPARIGEDGKPEIVYGHHRLEAARQEFPDNFEVRLIVKDRTDSEMLKMMLWENMEEWRTDAVGNQASIRAVVEAYANGKIELLPREKKTPHGKLRYAPGFCQGGDDVPCAHREHPYTAPMLVDFTGWGSAKVETTLAALELMERGLVAKDLYDGLTPTQASILTNEVRNVVFTNESQATVYEKQAETARKQADATEPGKERDAQEKLAQRASQQADAVRKRVHGDADYVAKYASSAFQDGAVTRAVVEQLKRLRKPPPLPQSGDKEPGDEFEEFLDRLPEYTAHVQQVRPHVRRCSPEQVEKANKRCAGLQQELAALKTDLKEVRPEWQQRSGARNERGGKEKEQPPRRYGGTAARRRRRTKARV